MLISQFGKYSIPALGSYTPNSMDFPSVPTAIVVCTS